MELGFAVDTGHTRRNKQRFPVMELITYAVPFFLLAIIAEIGWGLWRGHNTYRVNDAFSSLMLGILSQARKFIVLGVGGWVYHQVTQLTALSLWPSDQWFTWVTAFVLYDLCYYWSHRLGHERQILWAAHVAHHQSEDYNLSTALRQTSTGFLLGWVFYLPMYALGIPAEVVVTVGALNLIYQFWVHTQHIPELGWLEWIFVTPSNHRVHHAQNDHYLDKNYGGVFIVWDRIFGSYQRELPNEPCIYGIRHPIRSWSPLEALIHIYRDMAFDFSRAGSWRERLAVLTARTGWQPPSVAQRWPRPKTAIESFERFDPPASVLQRAYALLQIVAAIALLGFGLLSSWTALGYWVWFLALLVAGITTSHWLAAEAASLCWRWELLRTATVVALVSYHDFSSGLMSLIGVWLIIGWGLLLWDAISQESRAAPPAVQS